MPHLFRSCPASRARVESEDPPRLADAEGLQERSRAPVRGIVLSSLRIVKVGMGHPGVYQQRRPDAARAARFRLDVREPDAPFLPHSFHATFDEAFDEGLRATTGQTRCVELPAGWDFRVRDHAK